MIGSGHGGFKPDGCIAAGNRLALHAEGGNGKTVKYILRDQRQLHRAARGHVQRVDLVLPARMLGLPHPLLAHHVDVHGVGRRREDAKINQRAPNEHHQKQPQWNDRPCGFQQRRAFDLHGNRMALLVVENREAHDQQNHNRQSDQTHQHHEEKQRVHLRRNLRRLRRKEREVRQPLDEKLPDCWTNMVHSFIRSPFCQSLAE